MSYQFSPQTKAEYSIIIPGKEISDGKFTPAKIIDINRVDPKYVAPNRIHIKTKQYYSISKFDKLFPSLSLNSSLQGIGVSSIRAPYRDYIKGDLQNSDNFGIGRIYEVKYSVPVDPYDLCRDLTKNPDVEYAVPVFIPYVSDYTVNDPFIGSQWMVNNIKLPAAWDYSKGDKKIIIGIIDSGTDITHPDLQANVWTNPKEIPANGKDDDGNGKIDDVNGWDMVGNVTQNNAISGYYIPDNSVKPLDNNNSHGTHTAGCAAAVTNNNTGIASPGFNCMILPVKCSADNSGVRGIFEGYEGILYAANLGAQIINCSWGGPGYSPSAQDIINHVTSLGSLVVVSSGNESLNLDIDDMYPASYDNVMNVGSSNSSSKVSGFSNYGNNVTVYSPGDGIYSTMPNGGYSNQSGTSMASPVAAGVAGLVKTLHSNWTPVQLMHQIRSTSDNVLTSDPALRRSFYGRINALNAVSYNSTARPDLKIPGISVSEMTIEGNDILTDYSSSKINLTLKNYLSDASDMLIKITAIDKYISVNKSQVNVGIIKSNQIKEIDFEVQLLDINPWFEGYARVLITYESSGYIDYSLIKIPIRIESGNKFGSIYTFPDWMEPHFFSASSPDNNVAWAVGQTAFGGSCMRVGGSGGGKFEVLSNDGLYAVHAFDANSALIGSGSSGGTGNAIIYRTIDGGAEWTSQSVGGSTGFINAIHFFDDKNGIYIGDPKNGVWGLGRTTNAGASWVNSGTAPNPLASEDGYAGAHFWIGDKGWFGTTKGRAMRTINKGISWQASTVIESGLVVRLGFMDEKNGIAIYAENINKPNPKYLAKTVDGGISWQKNIFNFNDLGIDPVYVFTLPRIKAIYVLGSQGQVFMTKDLGTTWEPVLSQQSVGAGTGSVSVDGFSAKLWQFDVLFNTLDFLAIPDDAKRELTLMTDNNINYGEVVIGTDSSNIIEIKNSGEVDLTLKTVEIINEGDTKEGEFQFFLAPAKNIPAGKTQKYRIKFSPKESGLRKAHFKVFAEAQGGDIKVNLSGIGKSSTNVNEDAERAGIVILQHPVQSQLFVRFENPDLKCEELFIYDLMGNLVKQFTLQNTNAMISEFDISSLAQGAYQVMIKSENKFYHLQIIKLD